MAGRASSLFPPRSPLRCAAGMGRDGPPVVKKGAPYVATVGGSKVRRGGGWGSSVVCSPLANGAAGPAPTRFFMPRAAPSLNTRQGRVRPSGGAGRRRGPPPGRSSTVARACGGAMAPAPQPATYLPGRGRLGEGRAAVAPPPPERAAPP